MNELLRRDLLKAGGALLVTANISDDILQFVQVRLRALQEQLRGFCVAQDGR